ncbi:MAG TPA: DNA-processing protein DprA [Nitrospiraceae bacterium]|nr:DNA-processing protein DprA [Nitrospiraceae bacterium]
MPPAESLRSWLMLRAVRGVGDATFCRLVQCFGSPDSVLAASAERLMSAGSVSPSLAHAICQGPDHTAKKAIDGELKKAEKHHLTVITFLDDRYPPRLRTIPDPPPLLYVAGTLERADHLALAIVGSRKATAAGRQVTEELSRDLSALGFTIVSGLARGIDAAAHRGALLAKGRTVGVLGCGIDRMYPPEHASLRRQIESSGAVISELPLGSYPHGYHFPRRNRIISGVCLGVIVTEATLHSGSLITARLAADQGREVFALPGFVKSETSRGPNSLIKQGATVIESVEDVIAELLPQLDAADRERLGKHVSRQASAPPCPDENEAVLYDILTWDGTHIDDLIVQSGLSSADVSALLLSLELKGLVRQLPGHCYIRL